MIWVFGDFVKEFVVNYLNMDFLSFGVFVVKEWFVLIIGLNLVYQGYRVQGVQFFVIGEFYEIVWVV